MSLAVNLEEHCAHEKRWFCTASCKQVDRAVRHFPARAHAMNSAVRVRDHSYLIVGSDAYRYRFPQPYPYFHFDISDPLTHIEPFQKMSENTVFSFKVKCGTHIEEVSFSRATCGEIPTTDTLSKLITSRTGIPKENQKLIVHGRLIKPGVLSVAQSLHQFVGRTIILLGCTTATIAHIHKAKEDALKIEESFRSRLTDTESALRHLGPRLSEYQRYRMTSLPPIDPGTQQKLAESEELRQNGRFFGPYVRDAIPDDRDGVSAAFGVGLIPMLGCRSKDEIHIGCVRCSERFLIDWYAFVHQRLAQTVFIKQLRYEAIPTMQNKGSVQEAKERWERFERAWQHPNADLGLLLEELLAMDELLDYPDMDKPHLVLSPKKGTVFQDYVSLQAALDILEFELERDEDDWEEGELRGPRYFVEEIPK